MNVGFEVTYSTEADIPADQWHSLFVDVNGGNVLQTTAQGAATDVVLGSSQVELKAGTTIFHFWGYPVDSFSLSVEPVTGYRLYINGRRRSYYFSGSGALMIPLVIPEDPNNTLAYFPVEVTLVPEQNDSSSVRGDTRSGGTILWEAPLGLLRNGASAGALYIRDDDDERNNGPVIPPIYTPGGLRYADFSPEIDFIENAATGYLEQVLTNHALILIEVVTTTRYAITYYAIDAVTGLDYDDSSGSYTYTGLPAPFLEFLLEKPDIASGDNDDLRITRTEGSREVVVDQTRRMVPSPTESLVEWELFDWHQEGAATRRKVSVSNVENSIIEAVSVRDDVANKVSLTNVVSYQTYPWGEEVATSGPNPEYLTTFAYYDQEQSGGEGHYQNLKSAIFPGGNWILYEYYDDVAKRGQVFKTYQPVGNLPASPSIDPTQTRVTEYDYTDIDEFGLNLPTSIVVRRKGQVVAKSLLSHVRSATPVNREFLRTTTRDDYVSEGEYERTVIKRYVLDASDRMRAGALFSIERPDGSKTSYAYEKGEYGAGLFTPRGTNTALRVYALKGAATNVPGSWYRNSRRPDYIDPLFLIRQRLSMEIAIYDHRGFLVQVERQIFNDLNQFLTIETITTTYSPSGDLEGWTSTNGTTYESTWADGLKVEETSPTGQRTLFEYDDLGRVTRSTLAGISSFGIGGDQADSVTDIAYDSSDRVIGQTVSANGSGETLASSWIYNTRGQLTNATKPCGTAVTYTYQNGGRIVTATQPDGGTSTRERDIDGSLKSVSGTAEIQRQYDYDTVLQPDGLTHFLRSRQDLGGATLRNAETVVDWLSRSRLQTAPAPDGGTLSASFTYADGRLTSRQVGNRAAEIFGYNGMGELIRTGLDIDLNGSLGVIQPDGSIDADPNDRIREFSRKVVQKSDGWWHEVDESVYPKFGVDEPKRVLTTRKWIGNPSPANPILIGAREAIDINGNKTRSLAELTNRSQAWVTTKVSVPGAMNTATFAIINGLLYEQVSASGVTVDSDYDSLRRLDRRTDRKGTTKSAYRVNTTQLRSQTAPSSAVTTYDYDCQGRLQSVDDGLGGLTWFAYNLRGQIVQRWGSAVQPARFDYDIYGDPVTLETFQEGSGWDGPAWPSNTGTPSVTTWDRDPASGAVTQKIDALNRAVEYTYNLYGQVLRMTPARVTTDSSPPPLAIDHLYNELTGELTTVDFEDPNSIDIEYPDYNRLGLPEEIRDVTGSRKLTYDLDGDLSLKGEELSVTYYGDNRFLNPEYEAAVDAVPGRYKGLSLDPTVAPSDQVLRYGIQYDAGTGRLLAIDWPSAIAPVSNFYGYLDNSDLVNVSESRKAGMLRQHTDLTYHDNFNLPTSVVNKNGAAAVIAQADYEYDILGRRTRRLLSGGHANVYGSGVLTTYQYNTRHELTGSQSFFSDPLTDETQSIPGRALTWGYDDAGNRIAQNGSGTRVALTDELTARDVPGSIAIHGTFSGLNLGGANPDSLAVRSETAAGVQFETPSVQGNWYHADVPVNNAGGPVSAEITVLAGKPSSSQYAQGAPLGKRFVPAALESFQYDADGNLTRDGRWSYEYDARNRLISMETVSEAYGAGADRQRLEFDYDFLGRRVGKRVYNWDSGAGDWSLAIDLLFVYDGWNLIAEIDASSGNELVRTYVWGLDLSGTLQGAGGVGGLLMIRDHAGGGEVDYYTQYDGNGNVLGLIDDSGAIAASYEYDPFGNLIRIDGPYAETNPFRFSTKYTDTETGLVYYGHRYYSPTLARFLNRDPIGEAGGMNLYAFVGNDPVNRWDVLGLAPIVRPRVDELTADRVPRGRTIHFSTRSRSILADRMAYGEDDDPLDPTNYDPRYGIAYGDPDYTIKVAEIERAWAAGDSAGSGSDGLHLPSARKGGPLFASVLDRASGRVVAFSGNRAVYDSDFDLNNDGIVDRRELAEWRVAYNDLIASRRVGEAFSKASDKVLRAQAQLAKTALVEGLLSVTGANAARLALRGAPIAAKVLRRIAKYGVPGPRDWQKFQKVTGPIYGMNNQARSQAYKAYQKSMVGSAVVGTSVAAPFSIGTASGALSGDDGSMIGVTSSYPALEIYYMGQQLGALISRMLDELVSEP